MAERAAPGRERAAGAVTIAILAFASYAYFMPAPASNEISRFSLVRSLVERGRIDVDPFAETTADLARAGGHAYSDKAPGAALLAVPAYASYHAYLRARSAPLPDWKRASELRGTPPSPGERDPLYFNAPFRRAVYLCNLATNALAGAALVTLFYLLLRCWGTGARWAGLYAAALGAGSLVFAYSTVFFGHVLAGAALFAALVAIERAVSRGRWALIGGFFAGLAVLVELPAALGVAILGVYLFRLAGVVRLAGFVAGVLPPVLVLLGYQWAAFGSPLSTGYAHVADPEFAAGMSRGVLGVGWPRPSALAGMFFGRARGLFYLAPVLLLAVVGLARGVAHPPTRARAITATAIVLAFALLSAGYYMWWGGAALGPRHFVPALPFLCLGFAWLAPGARPAVAVTFAVLLVVSVANQLAGVAVSPLAPPDVDLLFGHSWGNLARGRLAIYPGSTNLGLLLGLPGPFSLAPLGLLWALGIWSFLSAVGRTEPGHGTAA